MSENEPPTPLEFLQSIYCDQGVPLPVRMRAAIEAAPYVHPKLSVVANIGDGFAERMKEIARAKGRSTVIDATANYPALSPSHSEK